LNRLKAAELLWIIRNPDKPLNHNDNPNRAFYKVEENIKYLQRTLYPGLIVMDLEIRDHVTNWDDARAGKNGISVMCIWDENSGRFFFYDQFNMEEGVAHLENADFLVTFNGKNFDIPVVEGFCEKKLRIHSHYDILEEIWKAMGGYFDGKWDARYKGTGLGPTCDRTLGQTKSDNGDGAPTLLEQSRYAQLYTYVTQDVHLTRQLLEHIMQCGYIMDPSGDKLCVRPYEELLSDRPISQ